MVNYRRFNSNEIAFRIYPVDVIQQSVTDSIGKGEVSDIEMLVTDRVLAGNGGSS